MKTVPSRPWRPFAPAAALLVLFACSCLTGCINLPNPLAKKTIAIDGQGETPPPSEARRGPITARDITVEAAEKALDVKDMARAELIATRLSARPDMPQATVARVSRVLAVSAAACSHPYVAMQALERWKEADPAADASFDWQNAYASILGQLPPHDAVSRAKAVADDENRPYTLRFAARLFMASRGWDRDDPARVLAPLTEMYAITRDASQRAYMERGLFASLHAATPAALQNLASLATDANVGEFPHAVIQLEHIRRMAMNPETKSAAATAAARLAQNSALVDASLLQAWDDTTLSGPTVVPVQGRVVVMALPLSGSLKAVGTRVAQGGREAVKEFAERGYTVTLLTIDTQDPGWLDQIAALPPEANIIGGPMRTQLFAEAHRRELTKHRVFMTFTPSLGGIGEEGVNAWRFFSSPEDQVNALLSFGEGLGFSRYSILLPSNDAFASRMANLFAAHAQGRGAAIVATSEYPADDTRKWHKNIESFMRTGKKASSQAIFLPDAWRNMDTLAEFLKYHENRQVLMGTSLWAQGLAGELAVPEQFEHAVFPGSWRQGAMSPAGARLSSRFVQSGQGTPDSWTGLGYDFVRFAATLTIPAEWRPAEINALLAKHAAIDWSMAPITWSSLGRATQHLLLFSPTDKGTAALTPEAIEDTFGKARVK